MPFEGSSSAAVRPEKDDQSEVEDAIGRVLKSIGIDIEREVSVRKRARPSQPVVLVLGKAGSGKTHVLAKLAKALERSGVQRAEEEEDLKDSKKLTFAVVSPTNKAATVLRRRGVEATTIHRVAYVPIYAEDIERLREWLGKPKAEREEPRPTLDNHPDQLVDRIVAVYEEHRSTAAALAAVGLTGADFIKGWRLRESKLDVALVDEASMLDVKAMSDLQSLARVIVAFGDPAQLAPIKSKGMAISDAQFGQPLVLRTIRRQALESPIVRLAHELQNPEMGYEAFETRLCELAADDPTGGIRVVQCVDAESLALEPLLCWTNRTRIDAIKGWRRLFGLSDNALCRGEPIIVEGIDLPPDAKKSRQKLERRGIIKGAQGRYLGPGDRPNFAKISLEDGSSPVSVSAIVRIESEPGGQAVIGMAAKRGVILNCAACLTIHKTQGSEFDGVSIFGPDIEAAARSGRVEDGTALWRRLAYVAITRARREVRWVTSRRMKRPLRSLEEIVGLEPARTLFEQGVKDRAA